MKESNKKEIGAKKNNTVKTYPVKYTLGEIKKDITIYNNNILKAPEDQIINQAFRLHSKGNIKEALKYYEYYIDQGFNNAAVFTNYGIILKNIGKLKEAENFYRKAIEIQLDFANAHSNLGNLLRDIGKLKEAEVSMRKALEIDPELSEAHCNLGNLLRDIGNLEEAEISFKKAIQLEPNYFNAKYCLGATLRDLGNLEEAEISLKKAIQLKPDSAEAYYTLGIILNDIGNLEEAEISTLKAIELNPDFVKAHFNLFLQYEINNNLEKLKAALKDFEQVKFLKNELLLFRARLSFRNREYKTAKKLIDNISPRWIRENINSKERKFWSYKAFIEDKVGNYDIAYSCFEKSQNDPGYKKYNKESFLNYIDLYKHNIKNKEIFITMNNNIEKYNIAFLIGFPRSGTTLLDTILRSHPDIDVLEEKPLISNVETLVKNKLNIRLDNLLSISEDNIKMLRNEYLKFISKYTNNEKKLIIDKMPLNTINLPLIKLLFPKAKIIFTYRNPYDTVLSCFQQTFEPNQAMNNFVDLKSTSKMYDKVMDAWDIYKRNLSLDYITSKYEELIDDFDSNTLKILDFLGVGWNDNVMNYRETALNRGKINTPSSSQVVQPLYKSSIEKWRNYAKYYEDCHQYLEKWVSYFDY